MESEILQLSIAREVAVMRNRSSDENSLCIIFVQCDLRKRCREGFEEKLVHNLLVSQRPDRVGHFVRQGSTLFFEVEQATDSAAFAGKWRYRIHERHGKVLVGDQVVTVVV